MTSLTIILASCWVLGGATITGYGQLFSNIGINDIMFQANITFEYTTTNAGQCALHCNQQDSCLTFTFHQSTCRGHDALMNSSLAAVTAPGARSFAKNIKVAGRCEGTGVRKLTENWLGLDTDVYCNDSWLVFQKRQDGSVDFNRNWDNYTKGFGDVNGEYWLGLETLHRITWTPVSYQLRVDLMKFDGTNMSAFYSNFTVGPAANNYTLNYSSFLAGSAGDALLGLRGVQFTTMDADHDHSVFTNCASEYDGGWWYKDCFLTMSNLNGIYTTNKTYFLKGIVWSDYFSDESMKSSLMMIRPAVN